MNKILETLDGFKTYILVGCAVALWLGIVFGVWTMADVQELFALLGILGVATFRDAIKKLEN